MKSICVFCGSRSGDDTVYSKFAERLGKEMAQQELTLVYGGGKVGLMGTIADAVLSNGGKVTGVIPQFLVDREVAHAGLTELIVVDSMHTRKLKMSELADAFIAMPGGLGTLEELAEIITWNQLHITRKPVGIYNVQGYYNSLLELFDHMVWRGFLEQNFRNSIMNESDPKILISSLRAGSKNTSTGDLSKT